ncbi:hypothetical protein BK659_12135 [Pseudomonas brassicacearum]|uniref:Uncharacterized protein n=1 Tax=Pseudomonas brassicacearum TaxID=930166 RepID=A0A423H719_9PSED|nr:hypothetical protein BK659_12135 [Pseudomonas brassicacearum]
MEKAIARQNHLITQMRTLLQIHAMLTGSRAVQGVRAMGAGVCVLGRAGQCAHMNSFSMVYRRLHVALGSLGAPGCSRIISIGWRFMLI